MAALLALALGGAWAHDGPVSPDALGHTHAPPASPGWQLGAAAAFTLADARDPWPMAQLPGVLGTGQPLRDARGLRLEHGSLQAAARFVPSLAAVWAVGLHDRDAPHVEAAQLRWRAWQAEAGSWQLTLGRGAVPTTPSLAQAGHFDRFSPAPLAQRALFEVDWLDDGLALGWQAEHPGGALPARAGIGLWRGRVFPAGGRTPTSLGDRPLSAHAGWDITERLSIDLFAAHLQTQLRGSLVQSSNAGHTHGAPTCEAGQGGRVCFDGRVRLGGLSVIATPWQGWRFAATGLLRDERGALYALNGDANYRARTSGGWAEVAWQFRPAWEAALRAERLVAHHNLHGPGASLVAADAGLLNNPGAQRVSAALAHTHTPSGWRFGAELGSEHCGGRSNPYVLLRAVWQAPTLLQGTW